LLAHVVAAANHFETAVYGALFDRSEWTDGVTYLVNQEMVMLSFAPLSASMPPMDSWIRP